MDLQGDTEMRMTPATRNTATQNDVVALNEAFAYFRAEVARAVLVREACETRETALEQMFAYYA